MMINLFMYGGSNGTLVKMSIPNIYTCIYAGTLTINIHLGISLKLTIKEPVSCQIHRVPFSFSIKGNYLINQMKHQEMFNSASGI